MRRALPATAIRLPVAGVAASAARLTTTYSAPSRPPGRAAADRVRCCFAFSIFSRTRTRTPLPPLGTIARAHPAKGLRLGYEFPSSPDATLWESDGLRIAVETLNRCASAGTQSPRYHRGASRDTASMHCISGRQAGAAFNVRRSTAALPAPGKRATIRSQEGGGPAQSCAPPFSVYVLYVVRCAGLGGPLRSCMHAAAPVNLLERSQRITTRRTGHRGTRSVGRWPDGEVRSTLVYCIFIHEPPSSLTSSSHPDIARVTSPEGHTVRRQPHIRYRTNLRPSFPPRAASGGTPCSVHGRRRRGPTAYRIQSAANCMPRPRRTRSSPARSALRGRKGPCACVRIPRWLTAAADASTRAGAGCAARLDCIRGRGGEEGETRRSRPERVTSSLCA